MGSGSVYHALLLKKRYDMRNIIHFKTQAERLAYLKGELEEIVPVKAKKKTTKKKPTKKSEKKDTEKEGQKDEV